MKKTLIILVLLFSTSVSSLVWSAETVDILSDLEGLIQEGEATGKMLYDDCILKNMKNIESDLAAKAIIDACKGKHKNTTPSEDEDNKSDHFHIRTICLETDALVKNDINYLPGETKPFTGNNLCEYENGHIKSKGDVKNGKEEGKWTQWYLNGQIEFEANFKYGELDGKMIAWFENGQIEMEGNFKDGKDDGKMIAWFRNGQIEMEMNFKDGELDGKQTLWYENGQKEEVRYYKNGKKDGKWTLWFENGQKEEVRYYTVGKSEKVTEENYNNLDFLITQLESCWIKPLDAVMNKEMYIKIALKVNPDRTIISDSIRIIDTNISTDNIYYKSITGSALNTFSHSDCQQLKLPLDKYDLWKNLTINFDNSMLKEIYE